MRCAIFLAAFLPTAPAAACDLALLLALDVSGSVDVAEYRIQRDGLALALQDSSVADALASANAKVSVMQWTGAGRQRVTIPWTTITNFAEAEALAGRVSQDKRVWRNFSTAVGEALEVGLTQFKSVPECARHVIDVSGDGIWNEGVDPVQVKPMLRAANITVNALVIEGADEDLTGWYWENVITGEGAFVETANAFEEYPDKIRTKLVREIVPQVSEGPSQINDWLFVITRFNAVITK